MPIISWLIIYIDQLNVGEKFLQNFSKSLLILLNVQPEIQILKVL